MTDSRDPGSNPSASLAFPLVVSFTVAAGTLLLQLLQTRIYGVVFWNHLVYFIISIALLGFGISGTWLSFGRDSWLAQRLTLRVAAFGFVLTALFSSFVMPQSGISIAYLFQSPNRTALMLATYAAAVLPYFFGGWMLGVIFRDYVQHIHKLYFADLIGAGLGCMAFLAFMQPVGAVNLVAITCGIVALPVLLRERGKPHGIPLLGVTVALVAAVMLFSGSINARIIPEPTKAFNVWQREVGPEMTLTHEFSEWNSISRIDVRGVEDGQEKRVYIDGDAWTGLMMGYAYPLPLYDANSDRLISNVSPYFFTLGQPLDRVLVIGSGGGVDVFLALRGNAQAIDAVEINPTTFRLLTEVYRDWTHNLIGQPGVTPYNEEGRSFVRNTDHRYDVIMMHGIDTFAAINAGAYVLSENYLYTVEGMIDYISHLSDDGILCITRWLHHAETPRLFAVCLEALYALGFEHPEQHIVLHGELGGTILVKRSPFSESEVAAYRAHLARVESEESFMYPLPESDRSREVSRLIHDYAAERRAGSHAAFLATLPFDIRPVYDDSPFFFHFDKPGNMLSIIREKDVTDLIRGHWPSFTLFSLLGFTFVAVVLFMMLPLMYRQRPQIPGFAGWLIFFTCLGVSFIFVEIALMQRFALLLGHPSRSLALVLAALLISAGIGSQLQGIRPMRMQVILPVLALLILVAAFVYPTIANAVLGWPLPLRALVTLALVVPLGIIMGMPFPTGLRKVSEAGESAVPWMWGINGGTTVLGSILAIILAIWGSFTLVLCIGAFGYALAGGVFAWQLRRG